MHTWIDEQPKVDQWRANFDKHPSRDAWLKMWGDRDFAIFMMLVDRRLLRSIGLGVNDLADFNSRDCFDAGMSPVEAAQEALANDDTFCHLVF